MGKKSKKNKEVRHSSREEARAGDGQIVRIGEKEKCTDCKNWIPWGFTMRIGTPPFRADCGPGAKCVSLFLYLHDVILIFQFLQIEIRNVIYSFYMCAMLFILCVSDINIRAVHSVHSISVTNV